MPKTKKSTRKVTINNDDGNKVEVTQQINVTQLKSIYTKWKEECTNATPALMRVKGVGAKNLLELVKNHGIENRPQAKEPVTPDEGVGKLTEEIESLLGNESKIVSPNFAKNISKYIKHLEDMADTKADPRNTPFTVPIYRRVNKKNAEYKKKNTTTHYGHYRTKDYNKYRNLKAKVFDNKEYAEIIDAVPSSWATTTENSSTPPMWQALYSENTGDDMLVSKGLLTVLKSARVTVKKVVNEHVKLKLRGIARGGLSKELYSVDDIKETILRLVGNKDNPGVGINPNTGNVRDDQIQRYFATKLTFRVDDETESNQIKSVFGVKDVLEGIVKGYSVDITRGMVKNLFLLTGLCARRSKKGPVYLKGFVTAKEKKEQAQEKAQAKKVKDKKAKDKKAKDKKKKDKKINKSWTEILVW